MELSLQKSTFLLSLHLLLLLLLKPCPKLGYGGGLLTPFFYPFVHTVLSLRKGEGFFKSMCRILLKQCGCRAESGGIGRLEK